ncbi:peptidase inhibitor family I36 protein [Kitasatospora sp. NPDC101801]|uniref:peptidase inhibitor family I36 protein n=1 Tax=Kitasatospora sp. NPDC101801 TaxID=3364103 RepID=UPI0037F26F2B
MKRTLRLTAAALGAVLLVPILATTAQADASDCEENTFCFFYNSNEQGSHTALRVRDVPDLAGYTFASPGNGQGQRLKNNAASAVSNVCMTVTVFYNSNYGGPRDAFNYRNSGNLVNTYNENASVIFAKDC